MLKAQMACRKHPFSFSFSKSCTNFINVVEGSLLFSWYYLSSDFSQASLWNIAGWIMCDSDSQKKIKCLPNNNYISRDWQALRNCCENMRSGNAVSAQHCIFQPPCFLISLFSASTIAQQFDISVYTSRYVFLKPS